MAMRIGISVHDSVTLWQPTERSLGPAMQHAKCRGIPLAPARTADRGLGNTKRPEKRNIRDVRSSATVRRFHREALAWL